MDPDEALTRMRAAIKEFRKMPSASLAVEIADYANALDEWLSKGGFPPSDWVIDEPMNPTESELLG